MEIDKDYLAHIFNDDIIYVLSENEELGLNNVKVAVSSDTQKVSLAEQSPKVKEESSIENEVSDSKPTYSYPKVLILLAEAPAEKEEVLLNNILKAVGLTSADVDRVYEHPAKFTELKGTKLLLSFHSNFAPPSNYEINIINGIQIIYAHDLSALEASIDHKKQLWGKLKQIKL